MSYDPSHRMPPRQERWPQATPAEGWPPYRDGEDEQAGRQGSRAQQAGVQRTGAGVQRAGGSHRRQAGPGSAVATAAFPVAQDAYGTDGYRIGDYRTGAYRAENQPGRGYAEGPDGYAGTRDDFDGGYGGTKAGYRAEGGYGDPGTAARPANAVAGLDQMTAGLDGIPGPPWTRNGSPEAGNGLNQAGNAYARIQDDYATGLNGYGHTGTGYDRTTDGYTGSADGYTGPADGLGNAPDGYPGGAYLGPGSYTETAYSGAEHPGADYPGSEFSGSRYPGAGYSETGYSGTGYSGTGYSETAYSETAYSGTGYSGTGYSGTGYFDSEYSDPLLTAPDLGVRPGDWRADQALRRAASHRGLMVSAATEVLATAVVIGVSTLAAGLLRSSVSPAGAMGTVFIDRMPAALRGFAAHHFGTHGRTVLLLGMYAVIAVIAIMIGAAARRAAGLGVIGVAAFTLVAAFIVVTRPADHVADVMPAVIGGLAGVAALLWLVRASAPLPEVTPPRPARGGTRRRTR